MLKYEDDGDDDAIDKKLFCVWFHGGTPFRENICAYL